MPLDHITLTVPTPKLPALFTFLTHSLAPLNIKEMMRPAPHIVGMGDAAPFFWITGLDMEGVFVSEEAEAKVLRAGHVAFRAGGIQDVRKFYNAAIAAGGIDNGKPGRRPQYHAGYYGAFVRDPVCGINFEVVFHECPEDEEMVKRIEEEGDKGL